MSAFSDYMSGLGLDWWGRFGEGSGTVLNDSSGNARTGSWNGAVALGATGLVTGDTDTAASFPGASTAYGAVPYGSWLNRSAGFSCGVLFSTTSTGANYLIQRWSDSGGTVQVFGLDLTTSNGVRVYVRAGGTNRILSATVSGLRDGNKHLLALDWDGSTLRMYIDGALATSMSATGSLQMPTSTDLNIGRRNGATTNPFTGTLDEGWFGPPFSAAQHLDIWDASNGTVTAPSATWLWSGGVTDTAFTVSGKTTPGTSVRLGVEAGSTLTTPTYGTAVTADTDGYFKAAATGLTADTAYTYGVELDGTLDTATTGHVNTYPSAGTPTSFSIGHASCALTGSNHRVFDAIVARSPLFFQHMGDLHYQDINTNDASLYRSAYDSVLTSPRQSAMFEAFPVDYIWDDHDFGADNSNKNSTGKPAAQAAYRQVVPHYPLDDTEAIYHWYMVGRVAFIVTDLRSYRDPNSTTDSATKTMLGATQKAWFKQTLLDARTAGAALIVWCSSQVYNTDGTSGVNYDADSWAAFTYERAELADYIRDQGLAENVIVIQGDAHMLAYDDGALSDFATGGGAPLPQFCAAALDQAGLVRGDNWSGGTHSGGGQYGYFDFTDDGYTVSYTWSGYQVDNTTGAETLIMSTTGSASAGSALAATAPMPTLTLTGESSGVATATNNRANGRIRDGIGYVTLDVPVAPTPATLTRAQRVTKAIAYPTPTLVDGRPT